MRWDTESSDNALDGDCGDFLGECKAVALDNLVRKEMRSAHAERAHSSTLRRTQNPPGYTVRRVACSADAARSGQFTYDIWNPTSNRSVGFQIRLASAANANSDIGLARRPTSSDVHIATANTVARRMGGLGSARTA